MLTGSEMFKIPEDRFRLLVILKKSLCVQNQYYI